jgi:hypothetical protein
MHPAPLTPITPLPQFDAQPLHKQAPQPLMQRIRLSMRKCTLQTSVIDTVTHAPSPRLGVNEIIRETHILHEIAADFARDFHDVVFVEGRGSGCWSGWWDRGARW